MAIPIYYNFRNIWARKLTTLLTALGIALVVFVFADVLMLTYGIEKTLIDTGSPENAIIIRKSSGTEIQSSLSKEQASIIINRPEISLDENGKLLAAKEVNVLITLPRKFSGSVSNVTVRGADDASLKLRPQIKIIKGRRWQKGLEEIIVGSAIAKNFQGIALGNTVKFAGKQWRIVGIFDAQKSGFDSEIWGDVDQIMDAFRRPIYSSVLVRVAGSENFKKFKKAVENDQRLTAEVKRENQYYAEQSEMLATFLKILGVTVTVIFSLGAVIGAMITMYAAVGSRTQEIGTLRALGFSRQNILTAFLIECLLISISGGIIGLFAASFMQLITISTINWQTFSELAFDFKLSPQIAIQSMIFAIIMGTAGGLLPSIRAAKIDIVKALRG
ncbi:MAG: ABC transporter permease [Candidatus Schekmanbacteria bacterium]|nr:MAG: ABC transporter permease [Candidatus Schekmanbacteria bacterium]